MGVGREVSICRTTSVLSNSHRSNAGQTGCGGPARPKPAAFFLAPGWERQASGRAILALGARVQGHIGQGHTQVFLLSSLMGFTFYYEIVKPHKKEW